MIVLERIIQHKLEVKRYLHLVKKELAKRALGQPTVGASWSKIVDMLHMRIHSTRLTVILLNMWMILQIRG